MSREEVFEKLNEVFRDVFDDEEIRDGCDDGGRY